jgi:hypothetical protein
VAAVCAGVLAAVAVGASAPASDAAAIPKVKKATFKVSVKGWQKNDWAKNHESTGPCDPSDHSHGGEYATFRSLKPVTVKALKVGKGAPQFLFPGLEPVIETRAEIARNAVNAVSNLPASCGDNGGGADPTAPDCGLKEISPYPVSFSYDYNDKDLLTIGTYGDVDDPYNACGNGDGMPYLLEESEFGDSFGSRLPHNELFDRKIGKLIVIGGGVFDLPMIEASSRTETQWEVSFTRKGKKKK